MPCPDENVLTALARDELPAAERTTIEAHIDACEACSEVVAELMRLFASSFSAGQRPGAAPDLSTSGLESTVSGVEPPPDELLGNELPLPEGAKLGRYVVLRAIGSGAMGIVYAAYDPELDRKIALKLLRRAPGEDADEVFASQQGTRNRRLLREAQALARLAHPHVITVHDVGTFEGGRVFLAMEFVEGGTLTRWLEARPRPWREVLSVLLQAGEGLAGAHAAGLVHRDFKPDNVLLRADGRAVVTDFGLARPLGRTPDDDEITAGASQSSSASASGALAETLTRTGVLVGTPAYMAPEQLNAKRSDAKADQFGFCVALYEGLYGERPFQARTLSALITAVHAGHVRPAPRDREVPRWLRRAVLRGLRVDPAERHPDMQALLTALRPRRLGSRRGVAAMGLACAAAGATVVALWDSPAPDPAAYCDDVAGKLAGVWDEAARAELRAAFTGSGLPFADDAATRVSAVLDDRAEAWTTAQAEVCRSGAEGREPAAVVDVRMTCLAQRRSMLAAMAGALRRADADEVMQAVDAVQALPGPRSCLDASVLDGSAAPMPEAEREAVAAVRSRIAESAALRILGKLDEARAAVAAASTGAEGLHYGPLQAELTMEQAAVLQEAGEVGPAEDKIYEALTAGVAHDHDEIVATAALALADLEQSRMSTPATMQRWVSLGLAALGSREGSALEDVRASLLAERGHAQRLAGDLDGAITTLEEALALRQQLWGPEHYAVAEPLGALGMVYARKGMHDESVRYIERAREILRATYGERHPNYAIALQNLGTTHMMHGNYADALPIYQEAHRLFRAGLGPRHPHVAVLAYNLSTSLLLLERYDEALAFLRETQELENEAYGARSRVSATSFSLLGEIHLRAGSMTEAEAALRQALAILHEVTPEDRRTRANYESQLGQVLTQAGRLPEADALLTAVLATQREVVGEPSLEVAETAGRLAMLRLAQGRLSEARTLVDASVEQYRTEDPDPHQHAEAWFRRARVLAAQGEHAAATAEAERARARYAELGDQPARLRAVEDWLAHL